MIDTDKYEGHEKKLRLDENTNLHIVIPPNKPVGPYNEWKGGLLFDLGEKAAMGNTCVPTARLMVDAPLLLAEVKQFHAFDEYMRMLRNGQIDVDDICDVWDEIRKEREE